MEIKEYFKIRIRDWYANAKRDYGVEGKFLDIETNKNEMEIRFEEMGKVFGVIIVCYREYTKEQLYNIWMESDWEEISNERMQLAI